MDNSKAIEMFHCMWDCFPGIARLIDKDHNILAANETAIDKGFKPGMRCCDVPGSHKECKFAAAFKNHKGYTDNVLEGKIRGWMPVEGFPDLIVHFTVVIPE